MTRRPDCPAFMRVRATATGSAKSNAIGQVELSCTPIGLAIGMYGVGSYTDGYAPGALTSGTRFTVPYSDIVAVREQGESVYLEVDAAGLPHNRLQLTRFTPGPGVPPHELRRRRLILHVAALSVAALAVLAAAMLAPAQQSQSLAWGALGYGIVAGLLVLALGYSLDQTLFLRPASSDVTRGAFLAELSQHYAHVVRTGAVPKAKRKKSLPDLSSLLPRTATAVGMTMAATILTALVTGQRLLMSEGPEERASAKSTAQIEAEPPKGALAPLAQESENAPTGGMAAPAEIEEPASEQADIPATDGSDDVAAVERRCLCDRADSQLWKNAIPKLSAILIERRAIPLKSYVKTQAQIAVVNNSDSDISEITLHVQFYEKRGDKRRDTKERPLYFEGPLRPGEAVKWKTEARGTDFDIAVPDLGSLGPNGDGSADADQFFELLEANHRPVRLHAARLLSYLGDSRARDGALVLKDAMRAAEAPYLRRILSATGDIRVCDIDFDQKGTVGACVYNAGDEERSELGVQVNSLLGSLDADHPLAAPPSLRDQKKWRVPGLLNAQSGRYVRMPIPHGFLTEKGSTLELITDQYDLLD